MRKFIFAFALLMLCAMADLRAQEYQSAIGARLGYPLSLSYKTFVGGSSNAVEVFANYRSARNVFGSSGWTRFGVGGAYQVHNNLENVTDNLFWYYGGGATVYFWSYGDAAGFADEATTSFGIQGYLGLDYKFENSPVNVSLDWVPTFFINGYVNGFGYSSGALAIRYTLK